MVMYMLKIIEMSHKLLMPQTINLNIRLLTTSFRKIVKAYKIQ